jgi:membrane protease YdiL (CAAX protease family)
LTVPTRFNRREFLVLWIASVMGVVAVIPYSLTLQAPILQRPPISLAVLLPIQVGENAAIFAVAVAGGLFLATRIGLGAPSLEAYLARQKVTDRIKAILVPSIALGVIASLIIIGLDVTVFGPSLVAELGKTSEALGRLNIQPPAWQGFLASFYGGIDEEIAMRLFLLSLFAFLGKFVSHTPDGRPTLPVLWIANILAAILFGLGHLPATAALVPITPLVVSRAVVLNGPAGVAFGYLYWTRGLESAMLSHFSADMILHVISVL